MFTEIVTPTYVLDCLIDSVQDVKRDIADTVITNNILNNLAHTVIDIQTSIAKKLSHACVDLANCSSDAIFNLYLSKK